MYRIRNKNRPDKVPITSYITEEDRDAFVLKCKSRGQSISTVIRQLVKEYIK